MCWSELPKAMPPTGVSPPSESSGMDRSRSSPDDPFLATFPKVPAASTTVVPRRASGKLNLLMLAWRIGVGVDREHSPVLVPVAVVPIAQVTPLI